MVYGIGTDIVSINKVDNILKNNKTRFINRILTLSERDIFTKKNAKSHYVAKRFAAKEAFAKALGTGIGKYISFQDIAVANNEKGKPFFIANEKIKKYLKNHSINNIFLSIADDNGNAIAFVVLEKSN